MGFTSFSHPVCFNRLLDRFQDRDNLWESISQEEAHEEIAKAPARLARSK